MTSDEMIARFKVEYDIANLEGPQYKDNEILVLLNQAQVKVTMSEILIRRWTYISNIIENGSYSTGAGGTFNYHRIVTPVADDYIGYVSSKSKVVRANYKIINPADWVDNIIIRKEDSGKYLSNSNSLPILINPRVYEDINGTIAIIHDRNTTFSGANDFMLEYVRRPVDIEALVNCEINQFLHEKIVNTAVDIGKKVFSPQEAGQSQQADMLLNKPEV